MTPHLFPNPAVHSVETVRFDGSAIPVTTIDGTPYVAIKPICKTLGLDWPAQRKRIVRDPVISKGMVMTTIPSEGGPQDTLFIPVKYFNGWMFGVDHRRVRPEIRDRVIKHQEQCYDALFAHFFEKQLPPPKPAPRKVPVKAHVRALPAPVGSTAPESLSIDEALALLDSPYAWMMNVSMSARIVPLIRALIVVLRGRVRHVDQFVSAALSASCDTSDIRVTRNDIGRNP